MHIDFTSKGEKYVLRDKFRKQITEYEIKTIFENTVQYFSKGIRSRDEFVSLNKFGEGDEVNPNQMCIVPFGTLFLRTVFKH